MLSLASHSALAQTQPAAPAAPAAPATPLTLADTLARARQNAGQLQSANIAVLLAREDSAQIRAARLPSATGFSQFIYTEGNGTPSGVFVANDGVHVYNDQLIVHEDLFTWIRRSDLNRTIAAETVARAKAEVAARGLNVTVVQNYYGVISAQRRVANLQTSVRESERFVDITQKQEQRGEVAHADVIKAQIDLQQRRRDLAEAVLNVQKAKIALGVLIYTDLRSDYSVTDDLAQAVPLPPLPEAQAAAGNASPDIKAATAGIQVANNDVAIAKYARLPTLALDIFYGINANQLAFRTRYANENGLPTPYRQNLGYVAQATLTVPIWNWGSTASKIRQAELKQEQARLDLSLAGRTLQSNLASAYAEVDTSGAQLESLRTSVDLATESFRLVLLRYQAGEATALEVVDAQNTLTLSRNAYDDGLARRRVAVANLQILLGAF